MNNKERQYSKRNTTKNLSTKGKVSFLEIDANETFISPEFGNGRKQVNEGLERKEPEPYYR